MEYQEEKVSENENVISETEQDKINLSKSELKRIETEKRVKRIHELMELIDKANEEMQFYQDELWDLLKNQIKLPNKQKRERKVRVEKNDDEEEVEGDNSQVKRKEKKEKEIKDIFLKKYHLLTDFLSL